MIAFVAELLSTIGMVLLAGEYIQGRSRWLNRFLERFIIRVLPSKILVHPVTQRVFPFIHDPRAGAAGLLRLKLSHILIYVVVPLLIILWAVGSIDASFHGSIFFRMKAESLIMEGPGSLEEKRRAAEAYQAALQSFAECVALMQNEAELKDPIKNTDARRAVSTCWAKWEPKRQYDIPLPFLQRAKLFLREEPGALVMPAFEFLFLVAAVFYFLSLGLAVSRIYSRLMRIESFILPVGFVFTAVGQAIKLVLVVFE